MEKTWRTRVQSSLAILAQPPGRTQGKQETAVILVAASACLASIYFGVSNPDFIWALSDELAKVFSYSGLWNTLPGPEQSALSKVLTWALSTIFIYLLVPITVVLCIIKTPLSNFGFSKPLPAFPTQLYLGCGFVAAAAITAASFMPAFQETYPFFVPSESWGLFFLWQVVYGLQICAVEFFFRGFLLLGLRERFGIHALWIMLVPYFLIHLGKPLIEGLASIGAGLFLGVIALRTKSILMPVALHLSMAWWMDILSLHHRGGLG